ncbi:MAG: hemerythrin domain-containing protein [Alphaproteobacteria bacterium]|nr:hemerythrin domain-containing protein [Alphaproteobacteria bacterium]
MTNAAANKNQLFEAFREDHAKLGKGFFELSRSLRADDLDRAKAIARELDAKAGAHIAFEEHHFYPRLRPLLGDADVDRMATEHETGLEVIKTLERQPADEELSTTTKARLLNDADAMSTHIAECGELFGAIGRLDAGEQQSLLDELLACRQRRPTWSEIDAERHR